VNRAQLSRFKAELSWNRVNRESSQRWDFLEGNTMAEMDLDFGGEESMRMNMGMDHEPMQDPIEMLKSDHRKVEGLFKQFESTEDKKMKQQLVDQICKELTVHARLEEELVYPLLKREDEEVTEEAFTEHELIKYMISELKGITSRDKSMDPKVKVLKELVEHHVKEEEEEALPELEGNEALPSVGKQMMERKQQLLDQEAKKASRGRSSATRKVAARSASGGKKTAARRSTGGKKTSTSRSTGTAKKSAGAKRQTSARGKSSSTSSRSKSSSTAKRGTSKSASASAKKTTTRKSTAGRSTAKNGGSTTGRSTKKRTTTKRGR
jgi:hemerythrin superfamily protein